MESVFDRLATQHSLTTRNEQPNLVKNEHIKEKGNEPEISQLKR